MDNEGNGVFWNLKYDYFMLSMTYNWHFVNLNNALRPVVRDPTRTLHVTGIKSQIWYDKCNTNGKVKGASTSSRSTFRPTCSQLVPGKMFNAHVFRCFGMHLEQPNEIRNLDA